MSWEYKVPGIPEDRFIRGDVPITKTEVRVISLSKLRLKENSIVLDIGCGTGSIAVEAALISRSGKVIAIDKNNEAVQLTKQNAKNFEASNLQVILGQAPNDLPSISFNSIFIGGSGGDMESIIAYAKEALIKDGSIVINTILLENTYKALQQLEQNGFSQIECTCLNISKGQKLSGWMMKALNPIYIISAQK